MRVSDGARGRALVYKEAVYDAMCTCLVTYTTVK